MSVVFDYFFYFVDNVLVFGQCNVEWCGYGFIFEEDIVFFNVSFDLIGQVCLFYQLVVKLKGGDCIEDKLVYFCDSGEFCNYMLFELLYFGLFFGYVKGSFDYVMIIVCNFLYSVLMVLFWEVLEKLVDVDLVVIVVKLQKEVCYYLCYFCDWLVCFGDGIDELYVWIQVVVDYLLFYIEEFWVGSLVEMVVFVVGIGVDLQILKVDWDVIVDVVLGEVMFKWLVVGGYVFEGKIGIYFEYFGFLFVEMQSLVWVYLYGVW